MHLSPCKPQRRLPGSPTANVSFVAVAPELVLLASSNRGGSVCRRQLRPEFPQHKRGNASSEHLEGVGGGLRVTDVPTARLRSHPCRIARRRVQPESGRCVQGG